MSDIITEPRYYADVDEQGKLLVLYVDTLHDDIPRSAVSITDEQFQSWTLNLNQRLVGGVLTPLARPPTPLTPVQAMNKAMAEKVALGITITSASTPALNTTFALDVMTLSQIKDYARNVTGGISPPPGFTYPDVKGNFVPFTDEQMVALYTAQRNLMFELGIQVRALASGETPVWPEQTGVVP